MDLATLKILRGAQTGVHVRLFSAVEPSWLNGSNPATDIKQKTHHMGTFFSFNWLRGLDYARPAQICAATVRKFVVIRTAWDLFSYTNFEPATALRCFKSTTTELF